MEKFRILDLMENMGMDKRTEFSEIIADMSQFAGALIGTAVVD